MELGWIDFSKTERNKVLNVLDLLGEQGVLDELGISTIRDGFSDLLFPGTSTIQTRAKYFLIVPYALKDLEFTDDVSSNILNKSFDKMEEECARALYNKHPQELGIIGRNAILQESWVKRPPSSIYMAGLRTFGIFNFKSIANYIKYISSQKQEKRNSSNSGNKVDNDEGSQDDANIALNQFYHLLNIPTYEKNWFSNLDINLTYDEGQFLKDQIISNCKGSLMAFILKNNMHEILEFDTIRDLEYIMFKFPSQIQNDYRVAISFSEFVFVLRVIYNLIVSEYKNKQAIKYFNSFKNNLNEISDINFSEIFIRLGIRNDKLKNFLEVSKQLMQNNDIEGLKQHIIDREIFLKGRNRARLCHPGEFDPDFWFTGERLDYRFGNVKVILRDIFQSEYGGD